MELLQRLRSEHADILQALERFEDELQAFEEEGSADIDAMRENLEWMTHQPLQQHVHEEQALCRALANHEGEARRTAEAMQDSTENLTETAEALLEQIEDMAEDVVVPRDRFDALARRFVAECLDQIEREENELFPLAERLLTDAEWQRLERGNGYHAPAVHAQSAAMWEIR